MKLLTQQKMFQKIFEKVILKSVRKKCAKKKCPRNPLFILLSEKHDTQVNRKEMQQEKWKLFKAGRDVN